MSWKRVYGETKTGVADNATPYTQDFLVEGWERASMQIGYSAGEASTSFIDGVIASGTVTVVDYTALSGATLTVGATVLTEGVEWTAATDNDTTAASLESAIEAVTNINASVTNNEITVTYATVGTVGNAVALVSSEPVDLTVSAATLTGGVDSDINDDDDEITIVDHGYEDGDSVVLNVVTGTAPTGLSDDTEYFVIVIDENTIQLASSYANAIAGTELAIAGAAAGGGEFDLAATAIAGDLDMLASNDGITWTVLTTPSAVEISAAGTTLWQDLPLSARYLRVRVRADEGASIAATIKVNASADVN